MGTVQKYTLDDMREVVREYSEKQGRAPQVGVMGSAADLGYSELSKSYAKEIGSLIGQTGATLIFGAEKTEMSLSTEAGKAARKAGGISVGITYRKGRNIFDPESASIVISTVTERGGMREAVLAQGGSDGIISIGGGTGTLTELATAYQTGGGPFIPLVGMAGTGGTTERYLGKKLDVRKYRAILEPAYSPEYAVRTVLRRILQVLNTGRPKYESAEYNALFEEREVQERDKYYIEESEVRERLKGITYLDKWVDSCIKLAQEKGITIERYAIDSSPEDPILYPSAIGEKGELMYKMSGWNNEIVCSELSN